MILLFPVLWLTAVWVVLWNSTTPATLLTGVVVAFAVTLSARAADAHRVDHRVRPIRLARYVLYMLVALGRSNIALAREVLTPTDYTSPGVIVVSLPPSSELVLSVLANSISLTPGTLTLEVRRRPDAIVVHVLHLSDIDSVRDEIATLHRMISMALVAPAHALAPTGEPR